MKHNRFSTQTGLLSFPVISVGPALDKNHSLNHSLYLTLGLITLLQSSLTCVLPDIFRTNHLKVSKTSQNYQCAVNETI